MSGREALRRKFILIAVVLTVAAAVGYFLLGGGAGPESPAVPEVRVTLVRGEYVEVSGSVVSYRGKLDTYAYCLLVDGDILYLPPGATVTIGRTVYIFRVDVWGHFFTPPAVVFLEKAPDV